MFQLWQVQMVNARTTAFRNLLDKFKKPKVEEKEIEDKRMKHSRKYIRWGVFGSRLYKV